jgi:hypothetical protein
MESGIKIQKINEVGAVTRQMSGLMACWSHKRIEMLRNETWLKKNEII